MKSFRFICEYYVKGHARRSFYPGCRVLVKFVKEKRSVKSFKLFEMSFTGNNTCKNHPTKQCFQSNFLALCSKFDISSNKPFIFLLYGALYARTINHVLLKIINSRKMVSDTYISRLLSLFTVSPSLTKTIIFLPALLFLLCQNGGK